MRTGDDPRSGAPAMTEREPVVPDDPGNDDEALDRVLATGEQLTKRSHAISRSAQGATTRDLLAEVASREPGEHVHPALDRSAARFVRWLLVALILAIAAIYGAMWWLDPISVTGRQTRFSIVENGGVRQAKLDLMEALPAAPSVLVLGSSRSMKLDPEQIAAVGGPGITAFNGGVSGGTTQDMYLYARYADELWGGNSGKYPHLVMGVVNDVLRYSGTAAFDPRLKRYLPSAQRDRSQLEIAKELLQAKTLEAAGRATRRVVRRDGAGALLHPERGVGNVNADLATTGKQRGNQKENLSARGMQQFDPSGDYTKPVEARVEAQMRDFIRRQEADAGFTGVDARGLEYLRRTIKLANRNGDVPTLWVTPFQPFGQTLLSQVYLDRDVKFRAAIEQLQTDATIQFEFIDLADISTFGGDPNEFYDGIHMTPKNTAKVIKLLDARGLLTHTPGSGLTAAAAK